MRQNAEVGETTFEIREFARTISMPVRTLAKNALFVTADYASPKTGRGTASSPCGRRIICCFWIFTTTSRRLMSSLFAYRSQG